MTNTTATDPADGLFELAPYPKTEEEATHEAVYRHLLVAAQVHWVTQVEPFTHPGHPGTGAEHMRVIESMLGQWSTLHLLRAIGKHLPEQADAIARELYECYEDGGAAAELLYEWLEEAGFDGDAVSATIRRLFEVPPPRPLVRTAKPPRDDEWHIRGIGTTHYGPYNGHASLPGGSVHGRRMLCGLVGDARYVAGPAPFGEVCAGCKDRDTRSLPL